MGRFAPFRAGQMLRDRTLDPPGLVKGDQLLSGTHGESRRALEEPSFSPDAFGSETGPPKHLLGIPGAMDLDGGCRGLDLIEIISGECDRKRPQILIQAVKRPCTK
jgi:hypothetical protein